MDEKELKALEEQINNRKQELAVIQEKGLPKNIFNKDKKEAEVVVDNAQNEDYGGELVKEAFKQAVIHQVSKSEDLQNDLLETAENYTKTKMKVIKTEVDTEHKKSVFKNKKDACSCYGFNEDTTPTWAIYAMSILYNVMVGIWVIIGTFTFMPIIFVMKKISVGIKQTWLAVLLSVLIYAIITVGIPLATGLGLFKG